MTPALTPEDALARLREISPDVRDAVVLDAAGALLAGRSDLAAAAGDLLASTGAAAVEVADERGAVFAARSARHAIVAVAARPALASLMFFDLRALLDDLGREAA